MTRRELRVSFADGSRRVVAQERDDSAGRKILDREAFTWLARPAVLSVEVGPPVRRTACEGGSVR